MQATIHIDQAVLAECEVTSEQLQEALCNAVSVVHHPDTGEPIYFNGVAVTLSVANSMKDANSGHAGVLHQTHPLPA